MKRNAGFSLVELMVAMVVGLIIILGAGSLLLTVFQTSRQVEALSERQAVLNFASTTLMGDIRRANWFSIEWNVDGDAPYLSMVMPNRGDISLSTCGYGSAVSKIYRLSDSASEGWALEVAQACTASSLDPDDSATSFSEIAAGFHEDVAAFNVDDSQSGEGVYVFNFRLLSSAVSGFDEFSFHAVNRTAAVIEVTE